MTCVIYLAGCSSLPGLPDVPKLPGVKIYRIEIQQGNYITQEMVAQLKNGMTREQVRYVLGTPLVTDIFHADRWDYVFYRERSTGEFEQRRLAVFFDNEGRLARVTGDVMPASEGAAVQTPEPAAKMDGVKPEPAKEEQAKERGFFGRILEKIGF